MIHYGLNLLYNRSSKPNLDATSENGHAHIIMSDRLAGSKRNTPDSILAKRMMAVRKL